MSRLASLVVLVTLALSAASARAATPIIGGAIDSGDPAVVMLAAYPSDHSTLFTCTAVVIAPDALLTAAHCVDHAGYEMGVFFGADASTYATLDDLIPQLAAVSAVHPHAAYSTSPPFTADIAIVNLAQPTTVTPVPFLRTAPTADMVGSQVRIVGYGETMFGTNNAARYAATTTIAALEAGDTILIGDQTARTCIGDSGGPALLGGSVVGIDSYSDTTGCIDPAHFRRTDAYLAFIDQYAGTAPVDPTPPPGNDPPPSDDMGTGGCAAGGGSSSPAFALALAALVVVRRRRRRA